MDSRRSLWHCIPITLSFSFGVSAPIIAQEQERLSLPLPIHPERYEEDPAESLPKESQPDRTSRDVEKASLRASSVRTPIPGQPGRNLPPIGESLETADGETKLGILDFVPHTYRNGGIRMEFIYTGETFTKARGGLTDSRRTNYRSNFDMVATLDTELMDWWDGGRLFVYGQNLSGDPLSASHVGDVQLFSNLDSTISDTERPHFTTIAEYWYEQLYLDGAIRLKMGKQDANADFAYSDLGGDFVHSSFGVSPNIPLPTFPSQALGGALFYGVSDEVSLGFGAYDGTLPSGPQGVRWGFDTLGRNGAILMYQLEYKNQFGPNSQLPHTTRFGVWNHTDSDVWTDFAAPSTDQTYGGNYGAYWNSDQMLLKEEYGTDDDQGLGVFVMFGFAPGDRNAIQEFYAAGIVYKGLLPNREEDILGVATANILFSGDFRNYTLIREGEVIGSYENAVEVFYKARLTDFITLQPDLQFISNPGGMHRDALVAGLRFEAVL
jgi:porin